MRYVLIEFKRQICLIDMGFDFKQIVQDALESLIKMETSTLTRRRDSMSIFDEVNHVNPVPVVCTIVTESVFRNFDIFPIFHLL